MAQINIFDMLKYECKTHPEDVIFDSKWFNKSVSNPNVNIYINIRKMVERQGCNWRWYCEYYNHDVTDELNFPNNIAKTV